MWCLVGCVFMFGAYFTFVQAVTLRLKHATLLRSSNIPKAALIKADLDYQRANIDESIQQYLTTCASDVSVEQFAGFIMDTEIGLFILLPFATSISYCAFSTISVLSLYSCIDDTVSKYKLLKPNPIKPRFNCCDLDYFSFCLPLPLWWSMTPICAPLLIPRITLLVMTLSQYCFP